MSLVLLAHTCSHLQNASLARLGLTSVPLTKQLHALLLQLQKHGYVNTVAIAGPTPPPPSALAPIMSLHTAAADDNNNNEGGDGAGGWSTPGHVAPRGDPRFVARRDSFPPSGDMGVGGRKGGEEVEGIGMGMGAHRASNEAEVTQENVSTRRLWVGLKYYNHRPVLERMSMVSKPKRRYWMGVQELEGLCLGQKRGHVRGLRGVGETMFVTSDRGVMDVREAVERRLGGMLLCRINGV